MAYLWTDEGWLYLAIAIDQFNREVLGWSLQPRMTADIVIDALTMAWFRRKPTVGRPICQPTFPEHAEGIRHEGLHESQGKLLG